MRQRVRTFMFWVAVLRDFGFNPFAAMMHFKYEADYNLRWLQMTEHALGRSLEPPEPIR